jgi:hypothetical protein
MPVQTITDEGAMYSKRTLNSSFYFYDFHLSSFLPKHLFSFYFLELNGYFFIKLIV